MKVLITGSNGMLGSAILDYATRKKFDIKTLTRDLLNFSNRRDLQQVIQDFSPDAIIHCAANTNVELCEKEPLKCYEGNVALTELLLNASYGLDCSFVFISSTGVYGQGKSEPYHEYDPTLPTTHHHRSKLLAENIVLRSNFRSLVIRTGWLFGGEISSPKNFVINRLKDMKKSDGELFSNNNQVGNPTWVNDVSKQIFTLLDTKNCGIFNCVNGGVASRYDYVAEIAKLSGLDVKVSPVGSDSSELLRYQTMNRRLMKKPVCMGLKICLTGK
jgi:dTDP-4-dehydrorhamnose reductase